MTSVRVDIDIDDILREMGTSEKEDLCRELIDDGYGPEGSLPTEVYHPMVTVTDAMTKRCTERQC